LLRHIFCLCVVLQHAPSDGEHCRQVTINQASQGLLIACRDLRKQAGLLVTLVGSGPGYRPRPASQRLHAASQSLSSLKPAYFNIPRPRILGGKSCSVILPSSLRSSLANRSLAKRSNSSLLTLPSPLASKRFMKRWVMNARRSLAAASRSWASITPSPF